MRALRCNPSEALTVLAPNGRMVCIHKLQSALGRCVQIACVRANSLNPKEGTVKLKLFALSLFVISLALPLAAKDKQYQDGTLITADKAKPNAALALQATAAGVVIGKVWFFEVQVGDFTYAGTGEHGKVKEGEWQSNSPVKIRFEKKGGGIASRTTMFIQKPDNKEIETNVYSISDKAGNQYCGKRKCDPDSAEKKAKEQN